VRSPPPMNAQRASIPLRSLLVSLLLVSGGGAAAAAAETFVRIENRWKPGIEINLESGSVSVSRTEPAWWSADWVFEPTGVANTYRIKNRWKNTYLNVEQGPLEASAVPPAYASSQWLLEPIETDYYRIKNVWKGTYLHVETGKLELGASTAAWHSGHWLLTGLGPVNRTQFERRLPKFYSYEIKEPTRGERLAVGAWDGANHNLLRWSANQQDDQRFVFMAEPGSTKVRLQTLRSDVHERTFVGITSAGTAITWPETGETSQQFEIVWQPDGVSFALREGTRNEFLSVHSNGGAIRWSGTDGKNDKPKADQIFQLLAPRAEAQKPGSLEDQLRDVSKASTYFVQIPYLPVQSGAGSNVGLHINGLAITGDGTVVVNYPWHGDRKGDLYWWKEGDWKTHAFDMIDYTSGERYPSGMQAVDDLVVVADNKYMRFFRLGATAVEFPTLAMKFPAGVNAEIVGMARHPGQDRIYVVTRGIMYRSPAGEPFLSPGTQSLNANFSFSPVSIDQAIAFGEAGLALVYDATTGNFLCLSLGPNHESFKVKIHRIVLDAAGTSATVTELPEQTLARAPDSQHGDDGLGSGASFRWGGTARVLSDGRLEIYAAPKRLDNVAGNVSKVLRWRLGPRFVAAP